MLKRSLKIVNSMIQVKKIKAESQRIVKDYNFVNRFKSDCTSFLCSSDIDKIKDDSGRILNGEYQIYNFVPYRKVVWNQDPLSGNTVKNALSVELIRLSSLYNRADIKNIWEQAHLHPIVTLAQCYSITAENLYAQKIIEILKDFYEKNPCGQSVTWKCCMDSSIRLANIVQAVSKITDTSYFKENEAMIIKCILEHILFVSTNYENKGTYPNNHYISDLVGVIWGSVYLYKNYNTHKALECYKDAIDRLEKEVVRQIRNDGFDYELSTYYHCFVAELLSETQSMLMMNGIQVPVEFSCATEKMIGVCNALGAFDGVLPLIGDQDGSRLFHYKGCFDIDRCDFSSLSRFLDSGRKVLREFGGIYVLAQDDIRVFFKCGSIGTGGKGTHDHNDQLSVCVFINGLKVICDSGTFCYTGDIENRKKYRSVRAHSTVHFKQNEQNDISNVFSVQSNYCGRILRFEQNLVQGEFNYNDGTHHGRSISINNGKLIIEDYAEGGISRLIIPVPYSMVEWIDDNNIRFSIGELEISISSKDIIEIQRATISKAYGVESDATYVDSKCYGKHIYILTKGVQG